MGLSREKPVSTPLEQDMKLSTKDHGKFSSFNVDDDLEEKCLIIKSLGNYST